jgi:hypothetical protein
MKMKRLFSIFLIVFLIAVFNFESTAQSISPTIRAGYYTEGDGNFFAGAGLGIGVLMFEVVPNAEYVFVSGGNYYTVNIDAHFDILPLPMINTWIGAGYALSFVKPENFDTQSNSGLNLIAGVGLSDKIPLSPYIMAKYVITETNQFVIAAGIKF